MQRYLYISLLIILLSCSSQDEPTPAGVDRPTWTSVTDGGDSAVAPDWTPQVRHSDPQPQWTAPDYSLYSSSMVAVIMMPEYLRGYGSDDDMFAAFIGDEIRGLAKGQDIDGDVYYIFGIKANDDETGNVVFKYYSRHFGTLFTADDNVRYGVDAFLGSASDPWVPTFTGSGFFQAYVAIPETMMPYASSADTVAIFVGDECRGIGERVNNGTYRIMASLNAGETFHCRYYNAHFGYIFDTVADKHAGEATLGTERNPFRLAFILTGKTPVKQTVVVNLPAALAAEASVDDILGVFVGNECRGVASPDVPGSFTVEVRGKITSDEMASLKYYSAKTRSIHSAANIFVIDGIDLTINAPTFKKD